MIDAVVKQHQHDTGSSNASFIIAGSFPAKLLAQEFETRQVAHAVEGKSLAPRLSFHDVDVFFSHDWAVGCGASERDFRVPGFIDCSYRERDV